MDFTLNINMDNSAFEYRPEREVQIIADRIVEDIGYGDLSGTCRDSNGNTVGAWQITG